MKAPTAQEDDLGAVAPTSTHGRAAAALAPSLRPGAQLHNEEITPGFPAAFLGRPRGGHAPRGRTGRLRADGGNRSGARGSGCRGQGVRAVGGALRGAGILGVGTAGALWRD